MQPLFEFINFFRIHFLITCGGSNKGTFVRCKLINGNAPFFGAREIFYPELIINKQSWQIFNNLLYNLNVKFSWRWSASLTNWMRGGEKQAGGSHSLSKPQVSSTKIGFRMWVRMLASTRIRRRSFWRTMIPHWLHFPVRIISPSFSCIISLYI